MKIKSLLLSLTLVSLFVFLISAITIDNKPWPVPDKYKAMKNPQAGKKDVEGVGAELWKTHCKSCHGKTGNGDGTKAAELKTTLNDMAESKFQSQTDGELYYKSIVGRDEMPNFEKKITDEQDRWMLVNYLRSFKE